MKELPTELGRMMRTWRLNQGDGWTQQEAADCIHVAKSTWSDIENGNRPPSLETARGLSLATGVSLDEINRMSGHPTRRSQNPLERLQRADAAAEVIPELGLLMDLFPELQPDEADMLLTQAESLVKRRRRGQK